MLMLKMKCSTLLIRDVKFNSAFIYVRYFVYTRDLRCI